MFCLNLITDTYTLVHLNKKAKGQVRYQNNSQQIYLMPAEALFSFNYNKYY